MAGREGCNAGGKAVTVMAGQQHRGIRGYSRRRRMRSHSQNLTPTPLSVGETQARSHGRGAVRREAAPVGSTRLTNTCVAVIIRMSYRCCAHATSSVPSLRVSLEANKDKKTATATTHHVGVGRLAGLPHVVLEVLPARARGEAGNDHAELRLLEGCDGGKYAADRIRHGTKAVERFRRRGGGMSRMRGDRE